MEPALTASLCPWWGGAHEIDKWAHVLLWDGGPLCNNSLWIEMDGNQSWLVEGACQQSQSNPLEIQSTTIYGNHDLVLNSNWCAIFPSDVPQEEHLLTFWVGSRHLFIQWSPLFFVFFLFIIEGWSHTYGYGQYAIFRVHISLLPWYE